MSLVQRRSKRKLVSCQDCSEPDDSDMAQCDECGKWSHFRCAKVGIEVEKFYWSCHRCTDTFKKAKTMKIKVKSKKPKIEIPSSFINRESDLIRLEDEEVVSREKMERKHLRPLSDLPFNKPQVNATRTVKSTTLNRKNDALEKMKEEIENLKKEIECLRLKTVSVDASTETDGEVGHNVYTETEVEVGRDASTETDVAVGRHVSTETEVEPYSDAFTETDGRDVSESVHTKTIVGSETTLTAGDVSEFVHVGNETTQASDGRDVSESVHTKTIVGSKATQTAGDVSEIEHVENETTQASEVASETLVGIETTQASEIAEAILSKFPFHEIPDAVNFNQTLTD